MTSNISVSNQPLIFFNCSSGGSTPLLEKSLAGYIIGLSFSGEWTKFVENSYKHGENVALETTVAETYFGNNSKGSLSCGASHENKNYICTVPFLRRYEYSAQERKINNGNMSSFYIPIRYDTIDKIEEKRNGEDLILSIVICGKIISSLTDDRGIFCGEFIVSSDPIIFNIPKSDWHNALEKSERSYIPSVENIFCLNELNKKIISRIKKAKRKYYDADYNGCIAECRSILEIKEIKTINVQAKRDDTQEQRFRKAFLYLKHLTQLAHHNSPSDPEYNPERPEAKCILAISIAFADLIYSGYFEKEDAI